MPDVIYENTLLFIITLCFYGAGIICAAKAILQSRTPQGSAAWVMSLLSFPMLSVPLFLIFGRSKFEGYNTRRRLLDESVMKKLESLKAIDPAFMEGEGETKIISAVISSKNRQPGFTRKNSIRLLVNAEETYGAMLAAMEKAQKYIILQSYIFRCDEIGNRFVDVMIRKAKEGVRVSFINDQIGVKVPKALVKKLCDGGVETGCFNNSNGKGRLQINFRNHRKILVVDGAVAYVGGHNIGDDYLGKWKIYGPWRDTHVELKGPSVIAAQLAAAKDWYCVKEKIIEADWKVQTHADDATVMVLHTGPADEKHACLLSHIAIINSASERLWIANPYFVPPESLMHAILLASLRGVDVRVLVPAYSDARSVMLASEVYQKILLEHGVKVYRYDKGFLHQKAMVVDESYAVVGSANFDCRSMFINFEISVICTQKEFVTQVGEMLLKDYAYSEELNLAEFKNAPLLRKITTRGANLMAPIL